MYETAVRSNSFLVIAHGAPGEAERARGILEAAGAAHIGVHPESCRALARIP